MSGQIKGGGSNFLPGSMKKEGALSFYLRRLDNSEGPRGGDKGGGMHLTLKYVMEESSFSYLRIFVYYVGITVGLKSYKCLGSCTSSKG